MSILVLTVCFFATSIGSVCGIGGGVIIKPVLDAMNIMSVSAVSFLSKVSVFSMAVIAVFRSRRDLTKSNNANIRLPLAFSAAVGGLIGQTIFELIRSIGDSDTIGIYQASILCVISLATLWFMKKGKGTLRVHHGNPLLIGMGIGTISSFLGIGGGPINIVALCWLCSMDIQEAASHSLNIILFSQGFSLLMILIRRKIPEFPLQYLPLMIGAGFTGGWLGSILHRKLDERQTSVLLNGLLLLIALVSMYNTLRFAHLL